MDHIICRPIKCLAVDKVEEASIGYHFERCSAQKISSLQPPPQPREVEGEVGIAEKSPFVAWAGNVEEPNGYSPEK